MYKKFSVNLQEDLCVEFSNFKKAEQYFIIGNVWKNVFFSFNDMEELIGYVSVAFHGANVELITSDIKDSKILEYGKFIEGFGWFVKDKEDWDRFICKDGEWGEIIVTVESEIYDDFVTECATQ